MEADSVLALWHCSGSAHGHAEMSGNLRGHPLSSADFDDALSWPDDDDVDVSGAETLAEQLQFQDTRLPEEAGDAGEPRQGLRPTQTWTFSSSGWVGPEQHSCAGAPNACCLQWPQCLPHATLHLSLDEPLWLAQLFVYHFGVVRALRELKLSRYAAIPRLFFGPVGPASASCCVVK